MIVLTAFSVAKVRISILFFTILDAFDTHSCTIEANSRQQITFITCALLFCYSIYMFLSKKTSTDQILMNWRHRGRLCAASHLSLGTDFSGYKYIYFGWYALNGSKLGAHNGKQRSLHLRGLYNVPEGFGLYWEFSVWDVFGSQMLSAHIWTGGTAALNFLVMAVCNKCISLGFNFTSRTLLDFVRLTEKIKT